jgi:transketolase
VSQGWEKWVGERGESISVERFGASAPYKTIFEHYGFTVDHVIQRAQDLIHRNEGESSE